MGKAELRAACAPDVDEVCFEGFLQAAIQAGKAQISGGLVGHPSSSGGAKAAEEEAAAKLEAALEAAGATPEALSHLLPEIVPQASLASRAFALLESQGKAVKVAKDLAFDAQVLDGLQQALRTWLQENGAGTAAQLRDVLGVSRKYAIPLLEYFDATGVTVRDGNLRRLR